MIVLPISIFLNIFDDGLCVSSENEQGPAMLDTASDEFSFAHKDKYTLGHRDMTRILYTITVSRYDFPSVKEKSILTIRGIGYKVVKPAIVEDDAFTLVCTKE